MSETPAPLLPGHTSDSFDIAVRAEIYNQLFANGRIPLLAELAGALGQPEDAVRASLQRLVAAHMVVLAFNSDEIIMANPFSGVATPFAVTVDGREYFGNCIWDALGIPAMLGKPGVIHTSCGCCGYPLEVTVGAGAASANAPEAVAHFALPAKQWWNDIVTT